jgi:predicted deacylase
VRRPFSIGHVRAEPGSRKSGQFPVGSLPDAPYLLPLTIINGREDGPVLGILSGQHGTEYTTTAAAIELIRRVNPAKLRGAIIVMPVVNVLGFQLKTRVAFPLDDELNGTRNLNRLWPGRPDGSLAHLTVFNLFNHVVKKCQFILDLHGGDIYEELEPCVSASVVGNKKVDEISRKLAEAIGYKYITISHAAKDRGRIKTEAPLIGIPTAVIEAGDKGLIDAELVERTTVGMVNALRYLKMVDGEYKEFRCKTVADMITVKSKTGGLFFKEVPIGTIVKKGERIGKVLSVDGSIAETVLAPAAGLLIDAYSNPAVASGETLAAIGILE